ncbi:MAG TPA: hypothetical protein VN257_07745 [Actinotalea sp.]|nr:hypothetical protein [Actinotalea sp.]
MAVFRVEDGRSVVVHPLPPAPGTFDDEVPDVVAEHLPHLLGEPLLLVQQRTGAADEPHLLALDRAGRPVVVETVAVLDEAALLAALRHAGRARLLRPADLAQVHRGGPDQLEAYLAAARGAAPDPGPGCRLVLVCVEVRGVEETVELLRAQGWVQVLTVGVLTGAGGERWLDVTPLGAEVTRGVSAARSAAVPSGSRSTTAPAADAGMPTIVPPPPGAPSTPLPRRTSALAAVPRPLERLVVVPVAADAHRIRGERPVPDLPYAFTGVLPAQAYRPGPDPRLVALARSRGGPTALVWHRARRGVSYEALLHLDGVIELSDGTRVTDPSAAAEMASGAQGAVDGWHTWRVETPTGPTLVEACASAVSA